MALDERAPRAEAVVAYSIICVIIMFGDSICRVTGKQQGSSGGLSYRDWTFETPGFDGVLSDDLLLGNNGGYCTITLYS